MVEYINAMLTLVLIKSMPHCCGVLVLMNRKERYQKDGIQAKSFA